MKSLLRSDVVNLICLCRYFKLLDLKADSDELHNLADDLGHVKLFEALKRKMKAMQIQTKGP